MNDFEKLFQDGWDNSTMWLVVTVSGREVVYTAGYEAYGREWFFEGDSSYEVVDKLLNHIDAYKVAQRILR